MRSGDPFSQSRKDPLRDDASDSIGCLRALRQDGRGHATLLIPANEINLAHRCTQSAENCSRGDVRESGPFANAISYSDEDQIEKPSRALCARSVDGQEMFE